MPSGLRRYQQSRGLHFLTFSCYRRQPFQASSRSRDLFELALEQSRIRYGFYVAGYVVMPEHVHLLMTEPERVTARQRATRRPEDWDWSSFRHDATGEVGQVEVESPWTAYHRRPMGLSDRVPLVRSVAP
jgi:putative transposase